MRVDFIRTDEEMSGDAGQGLGSPIVIGSRCAWTLHNFRRSLVDRLQREGRKVVAIGADLDGYETKLRDTGVDFRSVPVPLFGIAPLGDLRLFVAYVREFRRLRPRIVHMFTIKPVIYGTLAAALVGVPRRVCTVTGLGHVFTEGGWLVRTLAQALYRLALSQAHVVFFQNEDDLQLFLSRKLVDACKTRMVPGSGVDLERFLPSPERSVGKTMRFLMVARLLREKGVMEFVDAAECLAEAGLEAEFLLLGAEDSRNPTRLSPEEMARLKRSPVRWLGAIDDVRPEIARADVVVLPSYREGTSRVLLEAMASGKPVLTTDVPGCRQLVEPGVNGLLTPARDPAALANGMQWYISHRDDLAPMGAAARRFVEEHYSEGAVLDRFVDSYNLAARGADELATNPSD